MNSESLHPDGGAEPAPDPVRRRLPILLRQAWYRLNQAFRRRIAGHGITPDQFTVLRTIMEAGSQGLIQSELSAIMSSDPNTIASLLDRMEKTGLIRRTQDPRDRRAFRIQLGIEGRKKFRTLRAVAVELQSEVLSVLPPEKRDEFLGHLDLVAQACDRAANSALLNRKQKASR